MDELISKTFIGVYYNDADLLSKIEELKETGYLDDNIYVIAKNENDVAMLRSRTGADVYSAYDTWTDRFMDFLTGENHIKQMMYGIGMDTTQVDRYYEEVQHGGMMLYVDEGWALSVYSNDETFQTDRLSSPVPRPITDSSRTTKTIESEPSYGGYEPLQNAAHPEVLKSTKSDETIQTNDLTSEEERAVLSEQIVEEDPPSFPRK
ncbi:hypothetical protein CSV71_11715 [Sporosarcina sp. P21c]|uniref:general stress protein n=1 Tax=unclassified Sporosarcina TaxID=2647733 RepID=UPI000C16C00A|nr:MULTISPECIES: general stress protein [unclassified Sporosarcina]PIC68116.1 hypothetical protein CSV78_04820 [Sporosarcina sp. P16a]PIC82445.1 hypothetical protein CSV73_12300 [Sporosarcina sp. P1]PIC89039.1 hypothetical protein CSV71_11715 [Sporosarcina sp. P21c]PIC94425.1 hypothetical protein CSV70_01460 [Sporosarcina sp. P25]